MALEALNEVIKAEDKAKLIISEAQAESKRIINKETERAEAIYKTLLDEATNKANLIYENYKIKGQKEAEPILNLGDKEIQKIYSISSERKDKAINLVVERIVKDYGDS